jgi:hypothetical protein
VLATRDRIRDEELEKLEALWDAPAALEPLPARAKLLDRLPLVPGWLVAGGWIAFFLVLLVATPAPEPGIPTALWADVASAAMFLLLLGAPLLAEMGSRLGFGAATFAGGLGIALAVECHASAHHLGNWWLFELGATAALAGAAALGLVSRLRR